MKELLETVDYIHKAGVIHRDLKPENILVIKEENNKIVYCKDIRIIDFGFAAMIKSKDEMVEGAVGTPNYVGTLSPEIARSCFFRLQQPLLLCARPQAAGSLAMRIISSYAVR